MKFDDSMLRDALSTIHSGSLAPEAAAAIVEVARFAASVDGRMDMNEMAAVARIAKIIYAMSGKNAPSVPSTPVTTGWMAELDKRLPVMSTRELAFASAYLLVRVDGKVVPEEIAFGGALSGELGITPTRAKELTEIVDRALQD